MNKILSWLKHYLFCDNKQFVICHGPEVMYLECLGCGCKTRGWEI